MREQWREVVGFPDYIVSDLGRIKRKSVVPGSHGRPLKPWPINDEGHVAVSLYKNKKRYALTVQRVVTDAWMGAIPEGLERAHLNGDPTDNRLSNLKWVTHKENEQHKIAHGRANKNTKRNATGQYA